MIIDVSANSSEGEVIGANEVSQCITVLIPRNYILLLWLGCGLLPIDLILLIRHSCRIRIRCSRCCMVKSKDYQLSEIERERT